MTHLKAHRWLCELEVFGGRGEAATLNDLHEGPQLIELQIFHSKYFLMVCIISQSLSNE